MFTPVIWAGFGLSFGLAHIKKVLDYNLDI